MEIRLIIGLALLIKIDKFSHIPNGAHSFEHALLDIRWTFTMAIVHMKV